jgi:predicted MarR family transcription regulator
MKKTKAASRQVGTPTASHPELAFVSSAHLVSERCPELSQLEFALIMVSHAFNRWLVRCMAAAGLADLTALDVLVLHHVKHHDRAKKVAEICFILNIEDTHTVVYALKKLADPDHRLIESEKRGKEVFYSVSSLGEKYIERYRVLRETCLMESVKAAGKRQQIGEAAQILRTAAALYDQAARAAASL